MAATAGVGPLKECMRAAEAPTNSQVIPKCDTRRMEDPMLSMSLTVGKDKGKEEKRVDVFLSPRLFPCHFVQSYLPSVAAALPLQRYHNMRVKFAVRHLHCVSVH